MARNKTKKNRKNGGDGNAANAAAPANAPAAPVANANAPKNNKKNNAANAANATKKNNAANAPANAPAAVGGKRKGKGKTHKRKLSQGAMTWQKSVMAVYRELKAKNPSTKLKDAMKEAARRKKKGQL